MHTYIHTYIHTHTHILKHKYSCTLVLAYTERIKSKLQSYSHQNFVRQFMKDKVAVHEESEIDKTCAMEFGDDIEMESACAAGKMID